MKKAYWSGKILSAEDIKNLAKLTSKNEELSNLIKILYFSLYELKKTINYPIYCFVQVLKNLKNQFFEEKFIFST